MTKFRPCIDLHQGQVKQIVGNTLESESGVRTNFVATEDAAHFADLYRRHALAGGHVILLGPGNEEAALRALSAYPGGLQIGGGMHPGNAETYLKAGASHIIVTSYLFPGQDLDWGRLRDIEAAVGRERLVIDLSCRRVDGGWAVAKDRWKTVLPLRVDAELLASLADHCAEFLVHAADVEGLRQGMDWDLIRHLSADASLPVTYAGGCADIRDLDRLEAESSGRLDATIGSALDIFGGREIRFADCVAFNRRRESPPKENSAG